MNDATPTATPATLADRYDSTAIIILSTNEDFVEKSAMDINYDLRRLESFRSIANTQTANIDSVKEYLLENYDELGDHADQIASLLDIELTREVEYTVTMTATVTVTVQPGDDAESLIFDNLYIDSNNRNISVDDYEVDYSNES